MSVPVAFLSAKFRPKGESEYGPEEKLLRAIFGEKVKEVKDASAYTRPGVEGVVIDVKVFSRQATPNSEQTAWRQEALRKQIEQTWEEQCEQVSERLTEELRETLLNKELAYPTTFDENKGEDAESAAHACGGCRITCTCGGASGGTPAVTGRRHINARISGGTIERPT